MLLKVDVNFNLAICDDEEGMDEVLGRKMVDGDNRRSSRDWK